MDVITAAINTRKLCDAYPCSKAPARSEQGRGLSHAIWMLDQIIYGEVESYQAHRWLGYAQSIMVSQKVATLDSVKHINKMA